MIFTSAADWELGTFQGTATNAQGQLVLASGQSSGTWTSPIIDFGPYVSAWEVILSSSGAVSYETRESQDGQTWSPYTSGLVQPPQQYGQIVLTLGTGAVVSSLQWIGISTVSARSAGDIFTRLLHSVGIGINVDGGGVPALQLTAPPSVSQASAEVANNRLTVSVSSANGAQGFSFDLSQGTLGDLLQALQQNLAGWTIVLLPPPEGWAVSSLSSMPAMLLEDTPPKNLLKDGTLNIWTSVLWLLLRPLSNQLGRLQSAVQGIAEDVSLVRAEGAWLDRWGDFLGVPRYPGEPDGLYRQRLLLVRFTSPTPLAMQTYLGFQVTSPSPASVQILYPAAYQNYPTFAYSEAQVLDTYSRLIPVGFTVNVNILAPELSDVLSWTDYPEAALAAASGSVWDAGSPYSWDGMMAGWA